MAELDDLVDQYGEDVVRQAFALQEHIRRNGLRGVHYMAEAREQARITGHGKTKKNLVANIPRRP